MAAAIGIVDRIREGEAAERALTNWARGARYAGSGDRAAIRDLVFDVVRRWWSSAARGGGETGRQRLIGLLREEGADLGAAFSGTGHAPAPLMPDEQSAGAEPSGLAALDCPDWLAPVLRRSLGDRFAPVMAHLRHRAPLFVRVNLARADPAGAMESLAADGIEARPHPLSPTALEIRSRQRAVARSGAYRSGLVELQDAASQAVADMLPLDGCARVLDYCAGGGGKSLAMAARHPASYHAHDADPGRMRDIPARAARAGVEISCVRMVEASAYDLVLVDAPCSGSGAWRRAPEGKLRLDAARLDALTRLQDEVLDRAARHVTPGGVLAYATCSLCDVENACRAEAFADRHPVRRIAERQLTPEHGGDGFYCVIFRLGAR